MHELARFTSIGWDFDETLWGNESSHRFWEYIEQNQYQRHFIVTFRTGRMFRDLWRDLAEAGSQLLPLHFRGIHGVPEDIYYRSRIGEPGGEEYFFWKGRTCRELGIDLLVDDDLMRVWPGCAAYDIAYIHPDAITFDEVD